MVIYLDVKYTADAPDKIEIRKNTEPLTSNLCTGYTIHRIFKAFLICQLFLIISAL